MKLFKLNSLFLACIFSILALSSCKEDEKPPIAMGSNVSVNNTFTAIAQTNSIETDIGLLFGGNAGDYIANATVSGSVEFPAYLLGLYDIDISENSIKFEVAAQANDPVYGNLFRTLEAGTTDRYYFTFNDAQNVSSFSSDNTSVGLRLDSDKVLVVEIGEGFDFNPGSTFTISLN